MADVVTAFVDDPAARRGDEIAIDAPDGRLSYRDLLALVNRTGHVLRGLGVEPEQRVVIILPDGLAWAAAFFGALRIGAVAVPLVPEVPGAPLRARPIPDEVVGRLRGEP